CRSDATRPGCNRGWVGRGSGRGPVVAGCGGGLPTRWAVSRGKGPPPGDAVGWPTLAPHPGGVPGGAETNFPNGNGYNVLRQGRSFSRLRGGPGTNRTRAEPSAPEGHLS